MSREKPEKNKTDVVPVNPGSSLITWRRPVLFDREIDSIFDDFRRSFDLMMRPYFPTGAQLQEQGMLPVRFAPVDLIDNGDHYLLHIELPGFAKENVDVQINQDGLTVIAKKEDTTEETKKNYLHRERMYSAFERSLSFPEEVDPSRAEGTMNDGILELKVAKKEVNPDTKPRKIEIA